MCISFKKSPLGLGLRLSLAAVLEMIGFQVVLFTEASPLLCSACDKVVLERCRAGALALCLGLSLRYC